MADNVLNSHLALADDNSFYNVIRKTGMGSTPFWDSLNNGVPFKGSPKKGHQWAYTPQPSVGAENAYAEGSRRADIVSYEDVTLKNQLQIFKKTSGITGSEAEAYTVEKRKRTIRDQQMANRRQLRLDIENALISGAAPVEATQLSDVRKMGGVLHYIPSIAKFDADNKPISIKDHIDEAQKLMFTNGLAGERIVIQAGVDAFQSLQFIYSDKKQLKNTETTIHNVVTHVTSAWFQRVELVANPNFATNEVRVYAPSLINPVLLRSYKNKKCSDPEYDIDVTEDLFEMSLQIVDPFAMVQIFNIGV